MLYPWQDTSRLRGPHKDDLLLQRSVYKTYLAWSSSSSSSSSSWCERSDHRDDGGVINVSLFHARVSKPKFIFGHRQHPLKPTWAALHDFDDRRRSSSVYTIDNLLVSSRAPDPIMCLRWCLPPRRFTLILFSPLLKPPSSSLVCVRSFALRRSFKVNSIN